MTWQPELDEIERRRQFALQMGGEERVERHHNEGKFTIRERIDKVLDEGTFEELGVLQGQAQYDGPDLIDFKPGGHVVGMGEIEGRTVALGGEDYTSHRVGARKKAGWINRLAREYKIPAIHFVEGFGGGYEFRAPLDAAKAGEKPKGNERGGSGYTSHLPTMGGMHVIVDLLSTVPVVTANMGSVAGGPAAFAPASHFFCMVKGSQIFPGGPALALRSLGEDVTKEELGGTATHAHGSGVADNEAEDEEDCFRQIRTFLSYLPTNVWEMPPRGEIGDDPHRCDEELLSIIPRERQRGYNMRKLMAHVFDEDSIFEMNRYYGGSVITAFARLNGYPVSVIANDPMTKGGAIDGDAAEKMTRFIDIGDTFHLPMVQLLDNPGFMVGTKAEEAGTIRKGIRWMTAMNQSTVPWLPFIVRRAYGVAGAGQAPSTGMNLRYAWPSGTWGGIPVEGGVDAVFRKEIEAAEDPVAMRAEMEEVLNARRSPFRTAETMDVEDIIDPRNTRPLLTDWVERMQSRLRSNLGPKARGMRP